MKMNCDVILDLLPLYHDGVCSEGSRALIEEHLKECESCRRALEEIRKEISAPNTTMKDAGKAWKSLVRNLWIRRVIAAVLAVALTVTAALVSKEVYEWDQERSIWMSTDEVISQAYRLADGRVYVEFVGKEHAITNISGSPVNADTGKQDMDSDDYGYRMGYTKEMDGLPPESRVSWHVYDGKSAGSRLLLVGAERKDVYIVCTMADELPPATEEMEQKVAEQDALIAELMSRPGKGKE